MLKSAWVCDPGASTPVSMAGAMATGMEGAPSAAPPDSALLAWLQEHGLQDPRDFKFAFLTAEEAAAACQQAPQAAAAAWQAISPEDVQEESSWAIWVRRPRHPDLRPAPQQQPAPSRKGAWTGLRLKRPRADEGPANDLGRRKEAAKQAMQLALSWKEKGRLGQEWAAMAQIGRAHV